MEIQQLGHTLHIRGLRELTAANARPVREAICAAISPDHTTIELDLSGLGFLDGCGLGALVSLYKAASQQQRYFSPTIRLLHPQPAVRQVLELTRIHHLFDVVSDADVVTDPAMLEGAAPMARAA